MKCKLARVESNRRLAKCERVTASNRVETHSKEKGGVQKDLMVKNSVDSAEINIDTTIGERNEFEFEKASDVR